MASSLKSVFHIGLLIQTSGTAHGWKIRSHSLYHHKTIQRKVENLFKDYKTVHFIYLFFFCIAYCSLEYLTLISENS